VRPAWARTDGVQVPCGRTELGSGEQYQPLADGKGLPVKAGLEETRMQANKTTNRNHIEGLGGRGELAQDSKAHRFDAQGKWGVCARKVRALTWGDLPGHYDLCAQAGTAGVFHVDWRASLCRGWSGRI